MPAGVGRTMIGALAGCRSAYIRRHAIAGWPFFQATKISFSRALLYIEAVDDYRQHYSRRSGQKRGRGGAIAARKRCRFILKQVGAPPDSRCRLVNAARTTERFSARMPRDCRRDIDTRTPVGSRRRDIHAAQLFTTLQRGVEYFFWHARWALRATRRRKRRVARYHVEIRMPILRRRAA